MLTCITCSKQQDGDEDNESPRGISRTKDAVKSLTSQMKDIAMKVSRMQKEPAKYRAEQRPYSYFDAISNSVQNPYLRPGCSDSSPSLDYDDPDSRFTEKPPCRTNDVLLRHDSESKEWIAQVEPGIQITFVSLPRNGNDLKRIRFSREMFDTWEAQRWWGENYDRIMELYNVKRLNQQALNTPRRSEDGRESSYSCCKMNIDGNSRFPDATSSRDEGSVTSEAETEWMEEDEPGVHITIRKSSDGTRELRRVRFSRDRFGEVRAKLWWESNRERILSQYLC